MTKEDQDDTPDPDMAERESEADKRSLVSFDKLTWVQSTAI